MASQVQGCSHRDQVGVGGCSPQSQPALDLAHAILVPGPCVRMAFEGQPLGVVPQVTWSLDIRVGLLPEPL